MKSTWKLVWRSKKLAQAPSRSNEVERAEAAREKAARIAAKRSKSACMKATRPRPVRFVPASPDVSDDDVDLDSAPDVP